MTTLLWKIDDTTVDVNIQRYLAGDDVLLDRYLLPYDIEATIAHVEGLKSIGALTSSESNSLVEALHDLRTRFERGDFVLDERFEDCHSAIEFDLTDHLGDLGKKVHLGRSRNDQVLVAQRLFIQATLRSLHAALKIGAHACLDLAQQEHDSVMPGYTHLQRAVPSTIGFWLAGIAEGWIEDLSLLRMTFTWLNANPLGTAAGYGVNLPLDRDLTTNTLGFDRILINGLHAQNSRGKHEMQALQTCWHILQDVRRFMWDLSLFCTSEFDFVRMGQEATTGSSIMPNKRNPDLVELMRGAIAPIAGAMSELQNLLSLPSGYHRDLQMTKGPVIRGLLHTLRTVELLPCLLGSISFNREAMRDTIDPELHATDRAVEAALRGIPFRDAYRQAAAFDYESDQRTPQQSTEARCSPGGCGNLMLDQLRHRLENEFLD
ncbi:MAG: argininosuccinate lyase [Planctomycetota bacterium]|nr:argininosuccinate lyase [Planctomycetota bacterium]